ncbi:MAG: TolC family protein [Methylococcales bacterium]|nr:TolC family protein [Methylococcales bacterium]
MPRNPDYVAAALGFIIAVSAPVTVAETLTAAWTTALERNHQIKAAAANTSASEQQLQSAQGQRLPELNINTGYTQYSQSPTAIASFNGDTTQFPTTQAGSAKAQAMVTMPVYTSGRIDNNIKSAESSVEAAQQQEATSELNLKMQVAEAYIAVLRTKSAVNVAQSHVDSLRADSKDVLDRFDQGIVASNDVLAATVELANAEQQQTKVNLQLDNAKSSYNRLLDRALTAEVSLDEHLPDAPTGTLEELTRNALKQRPELTVVNAQIDALEQQAASVNATRLPQVNVNGGYQYQQNRYQAHEGLWVAGINMDWKLFDGSTGHKTDALKNQAIALKEQRDDLSSLMMLQVRQAWLEIEETKKRLATAEKTINLADENVKVATDRYQQGLSIHTEVLAAENSRLTSHDNLNNARYDMTLARLRLRHALGIL